YHFIDLKRTWFDARDYCIKHYHDLANIDSMKENNMVPTNAGGGWTGLSDRVYAWRGVMGNAPNSWRWSATGKINPDAYQNWMSTQPDNFRSQQHCVTMRNGQWTDDNCKSSFPFVCFTGSTEPGLKEFTYVSTSMTWAAAKNHCRQNYTDLAMIQDDAENTAVASVISSSTNVWIGLYRVPWVWSNGKISSFFNWAPGEPDNLDGAEHCAWVHENHQWSDESCSFMGPFFCQQSEVTPDLEFIYVSMSMTWAAASKLCRQNYTDLAMIQDDAENTAVASLVPSTESVWIGLHRVPWKWVKGRRASFINW
ncbi:hypothetical protein NQD34_016555, partial [Periophthalmus magnuspinnatus]